MYARVLLTFALALLLAEPVAVAAVRVDPNPILMDAAFRGGRVHVRGSAEPGAHIFVIVTGARIAEKFNRKGRIGPLWANVGSLSVSGVPKLCLIATSSPAPVETDRSIIDANSLDLDAVVRRAEIEGAGASRDLIQREYVRLKQAQGLFGSFRGGVRVDRTDGRATFEASLPWPKSAAPGDYTVSVVQARGRTVVGREQVALHARLVGLPAWTSDLAFRRGSLYGILCVVVALGVGFLTGLVFKKGGGH
ncbi:MAG: TIGR02186 family protein [Polyangiaceae bacterium]|nr:TIGR02186 family protein [Polyangiaceae bacterium]